MKQISSIVAVALALPRFLGPPVTFCGELPWWLWWLYYSGSLD